MDDLDLVNRFFQRDEAAIRETQQKYGRLCLRIARNILRDEADVEECVNDTYLSLWNTIPPLRPHNFTAFISRVTRNLSLKRLRFNTAQKRSAQAELSLSELEELLPDASLQADVDGKRLGGLINSFLWQERELDRNIFLRKYWFFDSIADIARRYSFSESKVKSILYRTRSRLKDYLKKEDIYL